MQQIEPAQAKELVKAALLEILEEQPSFIGDAVRHALEDAGLRRAIDEGKGSGAASRNEIFQTLALLVFKMIK